MTKTKDADPETIQSPTIKDADLGKVFAKAAKFLESQYCDLAKVQKTQIRNINLQSKTPTELAHRLLSELIHLQDTYQLIFAKIDLKVNPATASLSGQLRGEMINPRRHKIKLKLKEILWPGFELARHKGIWQLNFAIKIEP